MNISTMLNTRRLLPIILLFLLITESCTVTKRVHRKGWHVEWRKTKRTVSDDLAVKEKTGSREETERRTNSGIQENSIDLSEEIEAEEYFDKLSIQKEKETFRSTETTSTEIEETNEDLFHYSDEPITSEKEPTLSEHSEAPNKVLTTPESSKSANSLRGLGKALLAAFLVITVICAGLGMLLLLWIQAITSSALIIVLGIFMFAFWLAGLASLITAFVIISSL